jgi:hypothetical protein
MRLGTFLQSDTSAFLTEPPMVHRAHVRTSIFRVGVEAPKFRTVDRRFGRPTRLSCAFCCGNCPLGTELRIRPQPAAANSLKHDQINSECRRQDAGKNLQTASRSD